MMSDLASTLTTLSDAMERMGLRIDKHYHISKTQQQQIKHQDQQKQNKQQQQQQQHQLLRQQPQQDVMLFLNRTKRNRLKVTKSSKNFSR